MNVARVVRVYMYVGSVYRVSAGERLYGIDCSSRKLIVTLYAMDMRVVGNHLNISTCCGSPTCTA